MALFIVYVFTFCMANDFRSQTNLVRGLRNNNPLDVRPVSGGWQGQVGTDDENFAIFADVAWGIRAYLVNMYASINTHGTTTLREYINRYAPPSENNTSAYLCAVVSDTGICADATIPLDQPDIINILKAQLREELGAQNAAMITDDDINQGFALLNSPMQSFFSAAGVLFETYPVASYGVSAVFFIAIGLISFGLYQRIKNRK